LQLISAMIDVSRTLALALAVAGCQRAAPEPPRREPAPKASAPPAEPTRAAPLPVAPYRFPASERLVAIGDLHGDLAAARAALRLVGAIDRNDRWVGKSLVVVQTGDRIDRGDDDRGVLDLFDVLRGTAKNDGGVVHALNGNHETMNVELDFRYVTPGAYAPFADLAGALPKELGERVEPAQRGRVGAFRPGGTYARKLAEQNTIAIVGDTVFVHGGLLPEHVRYDVGRINAEISAWMRGETGSVPAAVRDQESPIWTRAYGEGSLDQSVCQSARDVLEALEVRRMVIGHTVQKAGISSACDGRIWRIDVGLSAFYGTSKVEALEIRGDQVRVLGASRAELLSERGAARKAGARSTAAPPAP
jgi:hypothetical protein